MTPVMRRDDAVLVALSKAEIPAGAADIAAARQEVLSRRIEHAAKGVRWGYLLGCERETSASQFPAAWRLWDQLRTLTPPSAPFQASFCKAYDGPIIKEAEGVHFEGLHIDTHPDLGDGTDLWRVLINLNETPRRFRFGDATRVELRQAGLYPDRSTFEAAHVEVHVPMREVEIPGRRGSTVSYMTFWASVVPHVGITEEPGYFLYSFEAVAPSPGA